MMARRQLIVAALAAALCGCVTDDGGESAADGGGGFDMASGDAMVDPMIDAMVDGGDMAGDGMAGDAMVADAMPADAIADLAVEPDAAPDMAVEEAPFSFFVTSLEAMRRLSGSEDGFGGDLGGVDGADAICQTIAAEVGVGHKTWRAFLSATAGADGQPVHAIERVGAGPWYDANGRLIAEDVAGLMGARPDGDPQTIDDLPDEHGVPLSVLGDSHDILTGSNGQGRLSRNDPDSTCDDWTSASGQVGGNAVMCGHSWPRSGRRGNNWMSDHTIRGCAPGVNLIQDGPGSGDCVGCGGGYGAIYCFALSP